MSKYFDGSKILIVTPEAACVPGSRKDRSLFTNNHTGTLAGMLGNLIVTLYDYGIDIYVAEPDYRRIFKLFLNNNQIKTGHEVPSDRVYLAEDRAFFYSNRLDSNCQWENVKLAIAFQREIINTIIPLVQPDLIHCHDWMTGLIPAAARELEIPCLFSVYKFGSVKSPLSYIEDMGIDTATFWQHLFYDRYPVNYQETRDNNPTDFLLSAIFAARYINFKNSNLMTKMVQGQNGFKPEQFNLILAEKRNAGCLFYNHSVSVWEYIYFYERILQRPMFDWRYGYERNP